MTQINRHADRAAAAAPAPGVAPGGHWSALTASYLGWTLDAFDYFLVVFCLTAIGREFRQSDSAMTLAITITLAFRPVGASGFRTLSQTLAGRQWPDGALGFVVRPGAPRC